jgi:plasmid stabilization system protein ParE
MACEDASVKSLVAILRDDAIEDVEEIARHIASDKLNPGVRFYEAVLKDCSMLAENPGAGALREPDNPRLKELRYWPIGGFQNYLIYYTPRQGGGIDVLRVVHGARDIARILKRK